MARSRTEPRPPDPAWELPAAGTQRDRLRQEWIDHQADRADDPRHSPTSCGTCRDLNLAFAKVGRG